MSRLVVFGVPTDVSEPREWEDARFGTVRAVSFKLTHPDVGDDKYPPLCEASNANIAAIEKAAKDGAVLKLIVQPEAIPGKKQDNGDRGRPWVKLQVVRIA